MEGHSQMTRKMYITAEEAAQLLSERLGRTIPPAYMYKLARRKKNPVRTQTIGNRFLYHRADIEQTTVTQKRDQDDTSE
jgi:hypothetical protein